MVKQDESDEFVKNAGLAGGALLRYKRALREAASAAGELLFQGIKPPVVIVRTMNGGEIVSLNIKMPEPWDHIDTP
jgi:hypothetical protein